MGQQYHSDNSESQVPLSALTQCKYIPNLPRISPFHDHFSRILLKVKISKDEHRTKPGNYALTLIFPSTKSV